MPSIKWIRSEGRPKAFPIFKKITTIGKASTNDIVIDDPGVADHHIQIVFDGKSFVLQELDPDANIEVNSKKKRRVRLEHGDRIDLSKPPAKGVELRFSLFDESFVEANAVEEENRFARLEPIQALRQLHELSVKIMQAPSVDEQMNALLDAVIEATCATKGFLVLLEGCPSPTGHIGEARIAAARNVQNTKLECPAQLSDSIIRHVIETQKPLIISDAINDALFGKSESVINLQLSSVICAPLFIHGNLFGVIYLGNDHVRGLFTQTSLDILTIFAAQASLLLQNAMLLNQLRTDKDALEEKLKEKGFGNIIGTSHGIVDVINKIQKVAPTDVTVLITGETGTGKELVAREIHRLSHRKHGPFVAVNCGAIPENLIESELFGHVKGAFTGAVTTRLGKFQLAKGGTLFLDEIGELPLSLQPKLLRAIQERVVVKVGDSREEKVDIRIIAATNRNLEEEIKKGNFREDLYYRLNVIRLHLPPLRERGDDVVLIARILLAKYASELNPKIKGFTPNALIAIRQYPWPGNVRELENRIKKAVVLCERTLIGPEDLDLKEKDLPPILPLAQAKEEFQRRYVLEVLERNMGNRTKTARDLGVDPRTIFRYLEREPSPPPRNDDSE